MRSLSLFLLLGCDLATVQPVAKPIQGLFMHEMDPAAVALAKDTRCDAQPKTFDEALAKLTVPVKETKLKRGSLTAAPMVLLVPVGWWGRSENARLASLREELAHYCQRREFPGFDQLWLTGYLDRPCRVDAGKCVGPVVPRSDYRAAFEIAAKRATKPKPEVSDFTNFYFLHDLEPQGLHELIESQW